MLSKINKKILLRIKKRSMEKQVKEIFSYVQCLGEEINSIGEKIENLKKHQEGLIQEHKELLEDIKKLTNKV